MTFLRRQETFRISSRGKGTYFIRGGGGRTLSRHRKNKKITIISLNNSDYYFCDTPLSNISTWCLNIVSKRYESAACMIIEDNPPLPTRQRHNPYQDTTQRFLNHLVLPKHRTSKFSSNRHRKLQPFRET
ncbi:uncharacterized protein LOC122854648 [Aphidius gifuensis]|uniref:uncharacterized protein LOC122854648 n=1 Tax=Aphidius gifuensis TaxID=684658 RepID=UPI001CDD056C|nr:uncharacterized protein LOC122854648 [Aphidius gifuensis]